MKNIYLIIALVATSFVGNAQNFVYSTEMHIDEEIQSNFATFDISFTTQVPRDITFEWKVISNDLPSEWDMSLCDYTGCYSGIPNSGRMTAITEENAQNGVKGFFKLNLQHMDFIGSGKCVLYVYDEADESLGDTVSFTLNYQGTNLSIEEKESLMALNVFPNPASEKINVEFSGVFSGTVVNSLGQYVARFEGKDSAVLDISELRIGVYFIQVTSETGATMTERIVVK